MKVISAVKEEVYIPSFNKNKELPLEEQVKVHLVNLSTSDRERYRWYEFEPGSPKMVAKYDIRGLMQNHVTKIEGFEDSNGSIESGSALIRSRAAWASALVQEIKVKLYEDASMEETEKGNS